jgi:iron complex outermembrane receptor protein
MKHIFLVGTISALIGQANATVETIEVKGQYASHVIEQTLSVDATTAPDMREQLAKLPGINVNSNGQISGIMQYRGMLGACGG